MSTDLHRALSEIADQAADAAGGLSVDAVLFQRRRRRTVHRSIGAGGIAAGIAGIAVVAGVLGGPTAPTVPATPTPTPTPSASPSHTATPISAPVCGDTVDGLPEELTLTGEPEQTLGSPVSATVAAADGVLVGRTVSLALVSDGVVIASTTPAPGGDLTAELDPCGGALAAGEYQVVAVADGPAGAVGSAPMAVTLSEPEMADPSASWEPLPAPDDPAWAEAWNTSYTSAIPGATQPLADGRYYAAITNLDPVSRSFDATILVRRWGDDALIWGEANVPEEGQYHDGRWEPIGLALFVEETAFGTQRMTIPADSPTYGWCVQPTVPVNVPQTLDQLSAPNPDCSFSSWIGPDSVENYFWLDIRGGEIRQMAGAFNS